MLDFEGQDIQVAVRLRPMLLVIYNRQESEKGSKRVIQMEDHTTVSLTNPENATDFRSFGFSHCYWSYDGFSELQDGLLVPDGKHLNGRNYCDQKRLFENFGKEIVQNSWLGFNSTLYCYGISKSGKSWSLFGNGSNKGLIQLVTLDLFKGIREKEKGPQTLGNSNEIKISMLEVYDNKVRDLFSGNSTKFKHSVKIREHPKRGFYVEGLKSCSVSNTEDVQQRIEEGLLNRAMSATSLSLISNKATVVVEISLVQKYKNSKGDESTLSALIDFYDLAGSQSTDVSSNEYSSQTKCIKKLGLCVNGLIESSLGKRITIPYTESTLTKMLERSIAGNSKTYVIATLSPADVSYQESLATLMFADKIQRLKTSPVINEELTIKLVRELKQENETLKKMLGSGDFEKNDFFAWSDKLDASLLLVDKDDFKRQIVDDIKSQIKDNDKEIKALTQSQEERAKLAKLEKASDSILIAKKIETEKKNKPHIFNLNSDNQLSGRLVHIIVPGNVDFGNQKGKDPFILISGTGIRENHGTFVYNPKENKVLIKPNGPECLLLVNGQQVPFETPLFHNDRIATGGSQIWIFQNPREPWAEKNPPTRLTFQFAHEEIALKSKIFSLLSENGTIPYQLKGELFHLSPLIGDANAMSEDLEKGVRFELVVIANTNRLIKKQKDSIDIDEDEKMAMVKVIHFKDELEFLWSKGKFLERFELMKSTYVQAQEDGIANLEINAISDPFMEDINTEVTIGYGLVSLKSTAYLVELSALVDILDFVELIPIGNVKNEGIEVSTPPGVNCYLTVEITPCNEFFEKVNDIQVFMTNPEELLGNSLNFMFKLGSSENFPSKYKDVYCKYRFNTESEISTGRLDAKSSYALGSVFKYERKFSVDNVTPTLLDYLQTELLILTFYGKQRPKKMRNLFNSDYKYKNSESFYLGDGQKQVADLAVFKKSEARLQQKLGIFQSLLQHSEELTQSSIPVEYIKNICEAKTQSAATEVVTAFRNEFKPPEEVEPVRKLTTYQKISEVCSVV